jgi:putative DNA primase/helicase
MFFQNMYPVSATNSDSYGKRGMEKHHINFRGNLEGKLPSDKRTSPFSFDSESDRDINFLNFFSTTDENGNQILEAAHTYAKAGYCVFPLQNLVVENNFVRCSCKDWKNCDRQGKHPRTWHGLLDATTDLETIKFWWTKWANANIGLVTGKKSNMFVLDVDVKSGGLYSLEDLQYDYGELPATLNAITGSGGRHYIFKYPDVKLKNSTSKIRRGLDIKSDGGYIVAPPSQHLSGGHYIWHGVNTPIVDAPNWLIALILLAEENAKQGKQVNSVDASGFIAPPISNEPIFEHDGRNTYIFNQARGLVNSYSPEEVERRIRAKNLARCVPPLDDTELARILMSAERYRVKKARVAA